MQTSWRTIGLIGAGRATGVTHLAVRMANYLAGVRREQVAVLEWNNHGDFAAMGRFFKKQSPFRMSGVDYYSGAGPVELASCLGGQYQHIMVDFGEITGPALCECARCDRKVMVGSCIEWRAEGFMEAAGMDGNRDRSWSYVAAFGSEETRREMEKAFDRSCLRIPTSVDPFAVTRTDMEFFRVLLNQR